MQKTINTLKTEGATVEASHLTCRSNANTADSSTRRQAERNVLELAALDAINEGKTELQFLRTIAPSFRNTAQRFFQINKGA